MVNIHVDLDNLDSIEAVDKAGMTAAIGALADQFREAVDLGRLTRLGVDPGKINNVVVLGMGGSGVSGDVARALFESDCAVPIIVNRYYRLPAFSGPGTLVIPVSYSGNTEETVSATAEALEKGCQVAVISSGGKLAALAVESGVGLVKIPSGLQPRAALAYLSVPLLIMFERLGLVGSLGAALDEAISQVGDEAKRFGPEAPETTNPAKQLARKLVGKMPVIYGSEGITALAAFRFKCQINENAKSPAQWNQLPELDHNELAGWLELRDVSRRFHLILLRDAEEHPQVKKRVEVTRELIMDQFAGVDEHWSSGSSKAARLFSLIVFGDFVSAYLALLSGMDPSPVERIELLKNRLV